MKKTMSAPAQSRTNTRIPSLIGVYDYTVVLTYAGMLAAFLGLLMLMDRRFDQAVFCLMAAGICDMFDGAVAATKDRSPAEKAFGIQIDSLSDLISFGVLPALFVYRLSEGSRTAGLLAALYVLCALIRLAWFNTAETERQAAECGRRRSYLGLPVTTIAVLLPLLYLAYHLAWVRTRAAFPAEMPHSSACCCSCSSASTVWASTAAPADWLCKAWSTASSSSCRSRSARSRS